MPNIVTDSIWRRIPRELPNRDRPPELAGGEHVAYLDGLRGAAILAVLMIHSSIGLGLGPALRDFTFYGVHGVQLFFIVSGMTLMRAHLDRPLDPVNFAVRRFLRIAPMFYFGAVVYLALGAWTQAIWATRNASPLDILATLLFVHGWLPGDINKVVPGGWSIAAEAMLYVVFPAILAMAGHRRRLVACVVGSYIVAGATYLLLSRLLPATAENKAFEVMFWLCQLPAFAGGCWLAVLGDKLRTRRSTAQIALAGSAVALIVDSQLLGHSNLLVAIMLLTIFVWAVANARPAVFQSGLLPYLGRISFSVYILHFMMLDAVNYLWKPIAPPLSPAASFVIVYGMTLVLSAAAASLTFRFVEQPFVRLGRKMTMRPGLIAS